MRKLKPLDVSPGTDKEAALEVVRISGLRFVPLENPETDSCGARIMVSSVLSGSDLSGYYARYHTCLFFEHKRPVWGTRLFSIPIVEDGKPVDPMKFFVPTRIHLNSERVLARVTRPVELVQDVLGRVITARCVLEIETGVGKTEEERSLIRFVLREKNPFADPCWSWVVTRPWDKDMVGIFEIPTREVTSRTSRGGNAETKNTRSKKRHSRK